MGEKMDTEGPYWSGTSHFGPLKTIRLGYLSDETGQIALTQGIQGSK